MLSKDTSEVTYYDLQSHVFNLRTELFHAMTYTRIISNICTVLYFFNVPPPRAINGDVPLLETVPLLFQPHFRGMLPCQIHVRHTHFRGFSPVQIMNFHSVLIMETEHFIF